MEFIPRKQLNKMFEFNFHKALQTKLTDKFILTNSAFSVMYFSPKKAPKNTKAQKKLWSTYDKVDENLKEFRKDNFITINGESYLVLTTLVPKDDAMTYDKNAEEPNYMLAHPGQILLQYFNGHGENIFKTGVDSMEIDRLEKLKLEDPHLRIFTYMPNKETYDFELAQVEI